MRLVAVYTACRHCVKTAKHIVEIVSLSGSIIIPVFSERIKVKATLNGEGLNTGIL